MAEALRAEGYTVETESTGRGALAWLASNTPDLMLLDLKLNDVDAPELLEKLQRSETRVPFVVVTGQGDERIAVEVMKRGALDYVMKNTAMLDLLPAVVRRALEAVGREQALTAARREQARLEGEVLAASERERQSIGADLHDGLGQLLTAVELMCTSLKEDTREQPDLSWRLDQMGGMLREAVVQTRFLARGLVPVAGGPEALPQGLAALAERTHALGRTSCEFHHDEAVEIHDTAAAGHLYRIAQEAVNNAVKHARASHIAIRLTHSGGGLLLEIEDDGSGFDHADSSPGAGLGIMRYRADRIGATLAIGPAAARGTIVTCHWPMPHENRN